MEAARSLSRRLFVPAVAALLLTGLSAFAGTSDKLFFIQRSKNANEVHYDARVAKDGSLDSDDPIDSYWLNKATNGGRESIGMFEKMAYGYDIDPTKGGAYAMTLDAFPERPMVVQRVGGKWRATAKIAGVQAYVNRLYVATDESGIMPTVIYVDLFGEQVGTGKAVQERMVK